MGNVNETALLIKEKGNTQANHEVLGKRIDSIYIRTPQNIDVLSIGLCSGISSGARAFLHIAEMNRTKDLLTQSIDLIYGHDRQISYYELSKPVTLKKGQHYCISVEVYGGATFTYSEMHPFSTHRDLIIEISREPPLGMFDWTSTASESSKVTLSKSNSSTNVLKKNTEKNNIPKREMKKMSSVKNLEESKETTPKRVRRTLRLETDMTDTRESVRSRSASKGGRRSSVSSLDSQSTTSYEKSKGKWISSGHRGLRVKHITGITFKRNNHSRYGCC